VNQPFQAIISVPQEEIGVQKHQMRDCLLMNLGELAVMTEAMTSRNVDLLIQDTLTAIHKQGEVFLHHPLISETKDHLLLEELTLGMALLPPETEIETSIKEEEDEVVAIGPVLALEDLAERTDFLVGVGIREVGTRLAVG